MSYPASSAAQTIAGVRPGPNPCDALPTALRCTGVGKRYGGLAALTEVSLTVPQGQIVGLIGPNGAGKTTLFNCISGFSRPDAGEVWLGDRRIDRMPADAVARAGVVRTFQTLRMFSRLTVFESLLAAQYCRYHAGPLRSILRLPAHRREFAQMRAGAREVMALLGLTAVSDVLCTNLPLLAQRKIEVARAILCRPRVLLLDEPSAGATPAENEELAAVVRRLNHDGTSILLIEHNVPFVTRLAHRVDVLHFGRLVASCAPDEVTANDVVAEIYLGGTP
jgi:ABC-type branched-subunit amino acid transport system ATPase component